jgi:hypothetical protein
MEEPRVTLNLTIHQFGGLKATIHCRLIDLERIPECEERVIYRQQLIDIQTEIERAWAEFQENSARHIRSTLHR